jgi:hypothetical protein
MSFREFADLVNLIQREHSPLSGSPWPIRIKYIDPHFDMRTSTVFSIQLRSTGGAQKTFHCQNECRDLPESLYERVVKWLKGE